MSVEKISSEELQGLTHQIDVEKKLPKANSYIAELAEPFMAEAQEISQRKERNYGISEDGTELVLKTETAPIPQSAKSKNNRGKIEKNLEILEKNAEKLENLQDLETYVAQAVEKGATRESAMGEYLNKLLMFAPEGKMIMKMSPEELKALEEEEGNTNGN